MLKDERHAEILNRLQTAGVIRATALARDLGVNPVTLRRDLEALEQQGHLRRIHGGAVHREGLITSPPTLVESLERRIAGAAARFIPTGSTLFIGPGTLTGELIPFLGEHPHLTIITNALNVAWSVVRWQRHTLHLLGGQAESDWGCYGDSAALADMRTDWVILEAGGIEAEQGLTHDALPYATLTRALFRRNAQIMVLAAPEQVGHASARFIAPAEEVDILITGREVADAPLWDLSELGIRIVLT